jgi:hypothetical protein
MSDMIRTIIAVAVIGALSPSTAFADLVRPDIGAGLQQALNLVQFDAKNCPAALAKMHDLSQMPDLTPAETKVIHDLGGIVTGKCDYATHHNGQFAPVVP